MKLFSEIGTDYIEEQTTPLTLPLPVPKYQGPVCLGSCHCDGNILLSMEIMAERYEEVVVTVVFVESYFYLCKFYVAIMETLVHTD